MTTPLLQLRNAAKRYPGVTALHAVDMELHQGEVLMLLGENGAGKSTLAGILTGTVPPDAGEMRISGEPVVATSRAAVRRRGINAVFQEFSLVPTLEVWENLTLGREQRRLGLIDRTAGLREARRVLDRLAFDVDPHAQVGALTRSKQQMVEIAKALLTRPTVLILDEPTAVLGDADAESLFAAIAELKRQGVGILYITHRMGEVRRLGDRVMVLRDGEHVHTAPVDEVSDGQLIELMVGRSISDLYPEIDHQAGEVLLRLADVSTRGGLHEAELEVRAGEIVGVAGLVGAGKDLVGRAAYGLDEVIEGHIEVRGESVVRPTPRGMLRRGLAYLPGDRKADGLVMPRPIMENCSLAGLDAPEFRRLGFIRSRNERTRVQEVVTRLDVRSTSLSQLVGVLSGGNQQKVMFGRALIRDMKVFVFEEPTNGIDVAARAHIYQLLAQLCAEGAGVMVISSDLSELLHLANRIYVIHDGRVQAHLEGEQLTESQVVSHFFGVEQSVPSGQGTRHAS